MARIKRNTIGFIACCAKCIQRNVAQHKCYHGLEMINCPAYKAYNSLTDKPNKPPEEYRIKKKSINTQPR